MTDLSYDLSHLKAIPQKSGVYLMKGKRGKVLYVGKAKKLRDRVSQYFKEGGDGRALIPYLLPKIQDIDWVVVSSEEEALLLENTLIKKHQPPYNLLLKDDKTYVSLMLNHKHKWPRLRLVRFKGTPPEKALYFGPYTDAAAAKQSIEFLNRHFHLRQCSDRELSQRRRPCILYGMGRCLAPCVGYCSKEEYDADVDRVIRFLKGQDRSLLRELKWAMEKASEELEFEKAQELLSCIQAFEKVLQGQTVHKSKVADWDVLGLCREGDELALALLYYRGGKLTGSSSYTFSQSLQSDEELLETFLLQKYQVEEGRPKEIILPLSLENEEAVKSALKLEHSVRLFCPVKGAKKEMLALANENAGEALRKGKEAEGKKRALLLQTQELLKLEELPGRIECFDTSHISGSERVAAMVVFNNGEKDSSQFRKYKIKDVDVGDDYAMMREVITRRFTRAKKDGVFPQMLLVDGGKGQLNIALQVLDDLDIAGVDVVALAKEGGRHDKGQTQEQIFLPGRKDPILLRLNHPVLFFLQRIRDEAHRFVIEYHRKRRSKRVLESFLDGIPGIGPAKKKLLLKHFGSGKAVREASEDELEQLKGLSKSDVRRILEAT